jgi:hypothetical protein
MPALVARIGILIFKLLVLETCNPVPASGKELLWLLPQRIAASVRFDRSQ